MKVPLVDLTSYSGIIVKPLSQVSLELRDAIKERKLNPNDTASIFGDEVLFANQIITHVKNIKCLPEAIKNLSSRFTTQDVWIRHNNTNSFQLSPHFQIDSISIFDTIILSDLVTASFPLAAIVGYRH